MVLGKQERAEGPSLIDIWVLASLPQTLSPDANKGGKFRVTHEAGESGWMKATRRQVQTISGFDLHSDAHSCVCICVFTRTHTCARGRVHCVVHIVCVYTHARVCEWVSARVHMRASVPFYSGIQECSAKCW